VHSGHYTKKYSGGRDQTFRFAVHLFLLLVLFLSDHAGSDFHLFLPRLFASTRRHQLARARYEAAVKNF
jgi:hypothetical protein